MDVNVSVPLEVPVEQTRKTSPLTDTEKFRIIELRKASISWRLIGYAIDSSSRTERAFKFE
jgi:hypothetical protein